MRGFGENNSSDSDEMADIEYDFVREKDARGGFFIKDGDSWREMTDEEDAYVTEKTKQAELNQLQEKLTINSSYDEKVADYKRAGKDIYGLEK